MRERKKEREKRGNRDKWIDVKNWKYRIFPEWKSDAFENTICIILCIITYISFKSIWTLVYILTEIK